MVTIRVYDGRKSTYSLRNALKEKGFQFSPEPAAHWWVEVQEPKASGLVDWCFSKGLEVETPFSKRSTDYRRVFFASFHPNWRNGKYLCAYCGRRMPKDSVSVDHLVAVKQVQRSRYYLRQLQSRGFDSVNDPRNLVPCCKRCNSKKGTKAGLWVLRGRLGCHRWFWHLVWSMQMLLVFAGIGLLSMVFGS